jgi:hypothetical protein
MRSTRKDRLDESLLAINDMDPDRQEDAIREGVRQLHEIESSPISSQLFLLSEEQEPTHAPKLRRGRR